MAAAPAQTFHLADFAAWRRAIAGLALLAAAAALAWLAMARHDLSWPELLAGAGASGAAVLAAWSLRRLRDARLRWDGERWHLAEVDGPAGETAGDLVVALDAGAWMLLGWHAGDGSRRRRWLPVGRRGLAGDWHALRCAVYSPRPAPGGSSAADTAHPPA